MGKKVSGPTRQKNAPRGAAPVSFAAREVRVCKQMAANCVFSVSYPRDFSQVQRTFDIAHHAMQHLVAMRILRIVKQSSALKLYSLTILSSHSLASCLSHYLNVLCPKISLL